MFSYPTFLANVVPTVLNLFHILLLIHLNLFPNRTLPYFLQLFLTSKIGKILTVESFGPEFMFFKISSKAISGLRREPK